jgi:hypothetical protein
MRTAVLIMSIVVLSGCAGIGKQKAHNEPGCTDCEQPPLKPTILQRMGFVMRPAIKAELLPPVAIDKSSKEAFAPAASAKSGAFVRPGDLSVALPIIEGNGRD